MTSDEIRWGILGSAKITEAEIGPAMQAAPRSRIQAVGSRRLESARRQAELLGATSAYGSYEELLADSSVDAVYLPLPNTLHAEWTVKALAAGKHVLCEKPMGMTAEEVRAMAAAAVSADRILMEGFMWRFHERVSYVKDLIASGRIGETRLVRATYTFDLAAAASDVRRGTADDDIRLNPDMGGGALTDLGSYCINGLRVYAGGRPLRATSSRRIAVGRRVETTVSGEIDFDNGVVGQFFGSLDTPGGGHVEILGTGGRIRMANAFRVRPTQAPIVIEIGDAAGSWERVEIPFADQYELELEHFAAMVLDGAAPVIPLEDSIENALTLAAVRRSWTDGPVEIPAV